MKQPPRNTKTMVSAKRITAPETRTDPKSGKKIALLSYIDAGSYLQHDPTTKDIFLYAAGASEPGEKVDGLDRLLHHTYRIHKDARGKVIGLDIIPSRLYRSGVIPISQKDVKTLTVQYDAGGAVARVTQRPFNVRAEASAAVIDALDKLISAGKAITVSMRLENVGKVVAVTENSVEVSLKASLTSKAVVGKTADSASGDFGDDIDEE